MKNSINQNFIRKLPLYFLMFLLLLFSDCPKKGSPKLLGIFPLANNIISAITNSPSYNCIITESSGFTSVTEGTGNDTYTAVLTSAPTSYVALSVAFDSTQVKINNSNTSPVELTFTPSNWSTAQTVTIEGISDGILEGAHTMSIVHRSSSSDSNYNGLNIASVVVTITDPPIYGITVTESSGSTSITEGTGNDTYTLVLVSTPTSNVTISIAFDTSQLKINSSSTSPIQLTFTSANWSTAQTITVEALYDNVTEGAHTKSITHTSSSSDSNYNGLIVASVTVTITDTIGAKVNGSF